MVVGRNTSICLPRFADDNVHNSISSNMAVQLVESASLTYRSAFRKSGKPQPFLSTVRQYVVELAHSEYLLNDADEIDV